MEEATAAASPMLTTSQQRACAPRPPSASSSAEEASTPSASSATVPAATTTAAATAAGSGGRVHPVPSTTCSRPASNRARAAGFGHRGFVTIGGESNDARGGMTLPKVPRAPPAAPLARASTTGGIVTGSTGIGSAQAANGGTSRVDGGPSPMRYLRHLLDQHHADCHHSSRAAASTSTCGRGSSQSPPQKRMQIRTLPSLSLPSTMSTYFVPPTPNQFASYTNEIVKAVRNNDLPTLKRMHEQSAIGANDNSGRSPSSSSSRLGGSPAIASSSPLGACNRFGESLLHMACRRGHTSLVRYMLDSTSSAPHGGASLNLRIVDDSGRTPLHDACWTSTANLELVKLLILKEPEMLWMEDRRGHCPLDYVRVGDWEVWRRFLGELMTMEVEEGKKEDDSADVDADDSADNVDDSVGGADDGDIDAAVSVGQERAACGCGCVLCPGREEFWEESAVPVKSEGGEAGQLEEGMGALSLSGRAKGGNNAEEVKGGNAEEVRGSGGSSRRRSSGRDRRRENETPKERRLRKERKRERREERRRRREQREREQLELEQGATVAAQAES